MAEQFLYVLRATRPGMIIDGPTDEELRSTGEHFEYLEGLCEEGKVLPEICVEIKELNESLIELEKAAQEENDLWKQKRQSLIGALNGTR